MTARKFIVRGRVQGVGFRYATREVAERLLLAGWAKNLPNGDVEVAARGAPEKLAELAEWLRRGPDAAEVGEVREAHDDASVPEMPDDFQIL
ncbi:MAG: acylphosphatase [Gammaproteobacteria bacterium]|nr:acylphosphatase [Gammaproteobacteria bacterium]